MVRKKYDFIIGIDPDTDKSGVCLLDIARKEVCLQNLAFAPLLEYLYQTNEELKERLCVVVEAGYLNKSNWHLTRKDSLRSASAKGNATGRNHETARKIIECCSYKGINVQEVKPLTKYWKGKDGKITHDELAYFIDIPNKTNQETRDATLLAWWFAGLPIKVFCS